MNDPEADPFGPVAPTGPVDGPTAWQHLVLATHLLDAALERQSQRDGGISHGHLKLLVLLSAATDQTLGLTRLAAALRFSQSRISHALDALERQDLVVRRPVPEDRRSIEAVLAPKGRLLVGRVLRGQRREIRDPVLDGTGDDLAALDRISRRIIETLDPSAGRAADT